MQKHPWKPVKEFMLLSHFIVPNKSKNTKKKKP
jgi:hypothetical protein